MSTNQAAKLAHHFILFINVFLRPMNKCKEKAHVCHLIGKVVSKIIKK